MRSATIGVRIWCSLLNTTDPGHYALKMHINKREGEQCRTPVIITHKERWAGIKILNNKLL